MTQDCSDNRNKRRSISRISWMCAVNVRGSGHQAVPVFPTKWVNVSERDARPLEYCLRLCGEEFQRWNPTFDCPMFGASSRTILVLFASAACCPAGATNEVAIELQFHEQDSCQDLIGEFVESGALNAKRSTQLGEKAATSVH